MADILTAARIEYTIESSLHLASAVYELEEY
jgi:hypothetical protein